jgi:cellulose synthase/poly-beta-1,6-N-acetylglucosamine synthase-like glycosyltransferase
MTPLSWFSLAVLVVSLGVYGVVLRGWHKLGQLRDVKPDLPSPPPPVSIIVAARNEDRAIEDAVRSILAVDYPALEAIVVDDRSTDATGAIVDRLAAEFPRLRVEHVRDLPAGWLGKNHALHRGAQRAHGDYLVFADADVIFEASAISRAISFCEAMRLDHLTVIPDVPTRSLFVELGMMGGFVGLLAMYRPWRARSSGRHDLGVGAFNLVRSAPFRALGGHETLAMEVLDDIELGGLMGASKLRQDMLLGHGMVSVEMYGTAAEMFRGIQKNVFTFLEYSAWRLFAATACRWRCTCTWHRNSATTACASCTCRSWGSSRSSSSGKSPSSRGSAGA